MHFISTLRTGFHNAGHVLTRRTRGGSTPAGARTRYQIALLRSLPDIEALWRVLESSGNATAFQAFSVFYAWVKNIAPVYEADWFVLAVFDQSALVPLMLLPLTLVRRGGLRVIEAADLGVCDFNAPVVNCAFDPTQEDMTVLWARARGLLPQADAIRITKMPAHIGGMENPLLKAGEVHRIKLSNFKTPLWHAGHAWSLDVLPEKLRQDLCARRRKLAKRGRIEFRVAATDAEADRYFAAMTQQREQRFAALGRTDVLACPNHRNFYRSLIVPGSAASPACIQALLLDGEPIATGYGLRTSDSFAMIFPTFKSEGLRNYSPGLQLFAESMTWAVQEGLRYYDFTIGDESFKLDLGAQELPLYEHLQALTLRAKPLLWRERARSALNTHPRLQSLLKRVIPNHVVKAWSA